MSLNIKNAETHDIATRLARLRGVSVTQAVTDALKGELDRELNRKRKRGLGEELMKIGQRCATHMHGSVSSEDHGTVLYDEHGLPR